MNSSSLCFILHWHALSIRYGCVWVVDLFDELPPAVYRWPASLPRICRQLWPLYTSAGIFLYVTPGGKLQLLVLLTQSDNGNKDIMLKTLTKVEENLLLCTQNIEIICMQIYHMDHTKKEQSVKKPTDSSLFWACIGAVASVSWVSDNLQGVVPFAKSIFLWHIQLTFLANSLWVFGCGYLPCGPPLSSVCQWDLKVLAAPLPLLCHLSVNTLSKLY